MKFILCLMISTAALAFPRLESQCRVALMANTCLEVGYIRTICADEQNQIEPNLLDDSLLSGLVAELDQKFSEVVEYAMGAPGGDKSCCDLDEDGNRDSISCGALDGPNEPLEITEGVHGHRFL